MYKIIFSEDAKKGLKLLYKKSPQSIKKLTSLINELEQHPRTGTGKLEMLKYLHGKEIWSRRINREHRLVYSIDDNIITVIVISVFGHYE